MRPSSHANRFLFVRTSWAVLCCLVAGCMGGTKVPIVPVGGHVTMNDKPVAHALILFENASTGFAATASIAEDGSYQLRSQYGTGIPPGKYLVSVSPPSTRDEMDRKIAPSPTIAKIPERYHLSQTSKLSAEVEKGKSTYDFKLDAS
jgi:hypothetical protein